MRIRKDELEKLRDVAIDGLEAKSLLMKDYALGYIKGYLGSMLGIPTSEEETDVEP